MRRPQSIERPLPVLSWGTVLKRRRPKRGRGQRSQYLVACNFCGCEKWTKHANFKRNKSCGCMTRAILRKARSIHGQSKNFQTGNRNGTPTWKSWHCMIERCTRNYHKSFARYKDVEICERWKSFINFLEDMGERPVGTTLGRKDNNGPYSPENCRWETPKEQANNRRNSALVSFNGITQTIQQWSEETGIPHDTLWVRLKRLRWPVDKALMQPLRGTLYKGSKHWSAYRITI